MKYNSILFGNGLTMAILSEMKSLSFIRDSNELSLLCNQNCFITKLLQSDPATGLHKDFRDMVTRKDRNNIEKYSEEIIEVQRMVDVEEIINYGFEYWAGKNLFTNVDFSKFTMVLYIMNNWWFNCFNKMIIGKEYPKVKKNNKKI